MALESVFLLVVLGLVCFAIASVCAVCICLTSTPLGPLLGVALGLISMQYLRRSGRSNRGSNNEWGPDVDGASAPLRGGAYAVVRPHSVHSAEAYSVASAAAASSSSEGETLAEAYLVAPLASAAVYSPSAPTLEGDFDKKNLEAGGGGGSAPTPSDPAADTTTTTAPNSCGDYGMFRDFWFAVLFIVNVVILFVLAVQQIAESYAAFTNSSSSSSAVAASSPDVSEASSLTSMLLAFFLLALAAVVIGGGLYLTLLLRYGEQIITGMLWTSVFLLGFGAVVALAQGLLLPAIISGIFCALSYWYMVACRDRIIFASAVLKTATTAVKEHYSGLMSTAVLALVSTCLYSLLWAVAFFNVYQQSFKTTAMTTSTAADGTVSTETQSELQPGYAFALFLLSVSFYWGSQVCKNVLGSTVSGTLAVWWFQPKREAAVRGSLFRACTTSFGSICLGSLLVAIVHAVRAVVQSMRDAANRNNDRNGRDRAAQFALLCVLCCAEWLLRVIEGIMLYFNVYAFCYCAAYGTGFVNSGGKVIELFRRRGWTALINDDLISNALAFGNLGLALGVCIIGVILGGAMELSNGSDSGVQNAAVMYGVMGFILGGMTGSVMTNILSAAVASVFVYFAEDPAHLQRNHPGVYDSLVEKWALIHPQTLWFTNTYASPGGTTQAGGGGASVGGIPIVHAVPMTV